MKTSRSTPPICRSTVILKSAITASWRACLAYRSVVSSARTTERLLASGRTRGNARGPEPCVGNRARNCPASIAFRARARAAHRYRDGSRGLDDSAGGRGRPGHLCDRRRAALDLFRCGRARAERVLCRPLRYRDGRRHGLGRASLQEVRPTLGVLGSSQRAVTPRRVLAILALAELLAMAPWFSASAASAALVRVWPLSPATTAWLTISAQLGFVAGRPLKPAPHLARRP